MEKGETGDGCSQESNVESKTSDYTNFNVRFHIWLPPFDKKDVPELENEGLMRIMTPQLLHLECRSKVQALRYSKQANKCASSELYNIVGSQR